MRPDDPRHGTYAGHVAGCRADCCKTAARNYHKRRVYEGVPRLVPSLGLQRRIQALACLGWSMYDLARMLDVSRENVRQWTLHDRVNRDTAAKVARLYDDLSMRHPAADTAPRRAMIARTQARARRNGWLPPLAWDDIDNPRERPRKGSNTPRHTDVDHAVVERVLAGEVLPTTLAERHAIADAWHALGRSHAELCRRMGWRDGRYGTRKDAA